MSETQNEKKEQKQTAKKNTGSKTAGSKISKSKGSGRSGKKKKRRSLSVAARRKQLRIRIGLGCGLAVLLLVCWRFLPLPTLHGRAVNLSSSVLQYQQLVEESCAEYSIPAYSQVVLAIMQQESAGIVPDVMQASESPFNTWYSQTPGAINDPAYSIRVGVETFAYCLEEAGCRSPQDTDALKLALQNYNYGNSYASWALENYGGYSEENAAEFSENMKARLNWSQYGDPQYVAHVLRYYSPGF